VKGRWDWYIYCFFHGHASQGSLMRGARVTFEWIYEYNVHFCENCHRFYLEMKKERRDPATQS
jgi:hypothetical protein